jgi:proteasome alpha subunit
VSMPFYVAPEQQMKDRADFARKGIARGRSVIVLRYADGILFVAENRSQALHKVSEIYDRIGFAAVGRYNEFENLRTAGIRYADLRGYSYDRTDVTGRGLANAYAQLLGTIFSSGGEKPYEVEIVVAELGATTEADQIYRLTYDGSVADEDAYAVMGGSAEAITETVRRGYQRSMDLASAAQLAVRALAGDGGPNATPRELGAAALEVAVLDRTRLLPRKFRRIKGTWLTGLLADGAVPPDRGPDAPPATPPAEMPVTQLGQPDG